jgi:hypothetical protein
MIGFAKLNHNSKLKRANTIGVILLTEYHASSIRLSASDIASQ